MSEAAGVRARDPVAGRAWRALAGNRVAMAGAVLLAILYALALLAPFLAPYGENDIDRARFFHPPTALHWRSVTGRQGPFVRATRVADPAALSYAEVPGRELPLRWFVHGAPYRLLGVVPCDRHLFGVDEPGRVFLLGADPLGRCELTRLLYGAQVSLTVGLVGILISFTLGMLFGGIAGYWGGVTDVLVMRGTEVLLSVPTLYLVLALRGAFPVDMPGRQVYLGIVVILALVGWAGLARVIRGMVLAIRGADYVLAAEALGMTRWRVLVRHILPNTLSFVIVAATIAVPGYILGEVFLSFLGMGVQEPAASWGNMLQQSRNLDVMVNYPWMLFAPAVAIFVTVLAFNFFGDGLRDALDPRQPPGGTR
jgi:peptide/nickel transport system permease protein